MVGAAPDHAHLVARLGGKAGILFQQLRIARDGVQRRAQFVTQADHIAALGEVGGFSDFLGTLKLGVGALMRVDFLNQERGLPPRFRLRRATALLSQHEQPRHHADDDGEREEHLPEHVGQKEIVHRNRRRRLQVDQPERQPDQPRGHREHPEIMPELRVDPGVDRLRQHLAQRLRHLRADSRMRLAEIVTARVERTAQRADRAGIGGAGGHVLRLEAVLADAALDLFDVLPAPSWLARNVIFAVGCPGDQRCGDEGHRQRHESGERFRRRAEQAIERADRHHGCNQHGADADRVDVAEMRALELDVLRP